MNSYEKELKNYQQLNKYAPENGIVLFGSSFFKEIPVNELKQSLGIHNNIYNRSFTNLSVFDAKKQLEDCVMALCPKKILLNLGETDLEKGEFSIPDIVEAYTELIAYIKSVDKRCEIIIVSVCSALNDIQPEELNRQLEVLANKCKSQFVNISPAFSHDMPGIKAFSLLKMFMYDKLTFNDAMHMVII